MAAALSGNPALAGLMQDKLNSLVGRSSGYIESLPDHIKRRVEGLKGLQVVSMLMTSGSWRSKTLSHHSIAVSPLAGAHQDRDGVPEGDPRAREVSAAWRLPRLHPHAIHAPCSSLRNLCRKYATKYAPIYERRSAIVNGKAEPTKEEVIKGEESEPQDLDDEDEDDEPVKKPSYADLEVPADAKNEGIPEFWLTALKNHVALSELIEERDEEALKALIDVRMSYLTDASGFKLEFVFDPSKNEYFTDSVLTKTYFYQDGVGYSGDLVYDHAEGCEIHWKEGECGAPHHRC